MSNFEYRDFQIDASKKMISSLDKVDSIILNGPTGVGKSALAYLLHEHYSGKDSNYRTTILCHQKLLQDQYADFLDGKNGIMIIKGKSNYTCYFDESKNVDVAPCQNGIKCKYVSMCDYYQRRLKMVSVPLLIINYQMVFSLMQVGAWTRASNLVVADECHNIQDIVTDFHKLSISNKELHYYDKVLKSLSKAGFSSLTDQVDDLMSHISRLRLDDLMDVLESVGFIRSNLVSELSDILERPPASLQRNKGMLSTLGTLLNKEVQFNTKYDSWNSLKDSVVFVPDLQVNDEFRTFYLTPLEVDTITSNIFESISPKRVFMSATVIPRVFIKSIGLKGNFDHIQLDNRIPVSNRKVIFNPIAGFNNQNLKEDSPEFKHLIEAMIEMAKLFHADEASGVIFTPSYKLALMLRQALTPKLEKEMGYSILVNHNAEGRESVLEMFRDTSRKKRLLISPSFSEGVNFEHDISRFQFIAKAPFRSLMDAYVKTKMRKDQEWYELDCLITMIQMAGRSSRAEDDYSVTFVFDSNLLRLYRKYVKDIHPWFRESVIIME